MIHSPESTLMNPRILIVDDHEVLREGVRSVLGRMRPEWEICGEGTDGDEAVQMVQELTPDVMLLDITMPRMSGLEASSKIRKIGLKIPILIFTTHQSELLSAEVREVGAQGYVLKSQAGRNLVLAIETVLAGGTFFGSAPKTETGSTEKSQKRGPLLFVGLAFANKFALTQLKNLLQLLAWPLCRLPQNSSCRFFHSADD